MNDSKTFDARQSLTTPRAAAVAGILFALLYGGCLVLIRLSVPTNLLADNGSWLERYSRIVSLALNLIPYAGIAFLWFIGVIRDRVGSLEDRFFSAVLQKRGLPSLSLNGMCIYIIPNHIRLAIYDSFN